MECGRGGSAQVCQPETAASITSAGRFSPLGPRGMGDVIKIAGYPLQSLVVGRKTINTSFVIDISDGHMPSGPFLIPEGQH